MKEKIFYCLVLTGLASSVWAQSSDSSERVRKALQDHNREKEYLEFVKSSESIAVELFNQLEKQGYLNDSGLAFIPLVSCWTNVNTKNISWKSKVAEEDECKKRYFINWIAEIIQVANNVYDINPDKFKDCAEKSISLLGPRGRKSEAIKGFEKKCSNTDYYTRSHAEEVSCVQEITSYSYSYEYNYHSYTFFDLIPRGIKKATATAHPIVDTEAQAFCDAINNNLDVAQRTLIQMEEYRKVFGHEIFHGSYRYSFNYLDAIDMHDFEINDLMKECIQTIKADYENEDDYNGFPESSVLHAFRKCTPEAQPDNVL